MNLLKPFLLERYFARYEFTAQYLLSSSDCESLSIREVLAFEPGSAEKFQNLWLGYGESQGSPSLRREISKIYSSISPDQVLVHSGAEEAILLFMQAALEPSDEVIVHSPCYQALAEIPRALGSKVIPWMANQSKNWELDLSELKTKLSSKTKAIIVNFPHNPTGFVPKKEFFNELAALAHQKGIVLFSDEVYRESEYDLKDRLSAACDLSESAISLGVMSKSYGLPGLRIGWVATKNKKILNRMAELKDYTTICNSGPSEFLAEVGLRHRNKLLARNLTIIKDNLNLLDEFFSRHQKLFLWQRPKAGPIAFPKLLSEVSDSFCARVVEECGVMLLPGSVFGDYPNHFRVGFGRSNLSEVVEKFETFL